jgi:succinate dehydrogenase / fumarate reductase flavoprotein subunit
MEMGELMVADALNRNESCGGHFREEYTADNEAQRNDEEYAYVAAWEWTDTNAAPIMHKEPLKFENVELKTRSYK